tara:strand:- start:8335 stop:9138 length:804 start_codon:yes stop_codon:yes gene_type:complete
MSSGDLKNELIIFFKSQLMLFYFFLSSLPLYSQTFFESKIDPILIDIDNASEIQNLNSDSLKWYLYSQVPDLSKLTPDNRKKKFINFILPAILIEKEKIKTAYDYVFDNFNKINPNEITQPLFDYCNCIDKYELLLCLSDQPNSIIIAQAAIESGWGTSRFFKQGYNLFGVHTTKNDSNKMAANDSQLIYVKKYNSISESISHYLRTLARVDAYHEFREQRVVSNDVKKLISYLTNYSERRELYVEDILEIIEYNQLCRYDTISFHK